MVNIRWDIYNMFTIWLMVLIMFAAFGLGRSLFVGGSADATA